MESISAVLPDGRSIPVRYHEMPGGGLIALAVAADGLPGGNKS